MIENLISLKYIMERIQNKIYSSNNELKGLKKNLI